MALRYCLFFATIVPICLFMGCFPKIDSKDVTQASSYRLIPAVLNFGKIRESEGRVLLQFAIQNLSSEPLKITKVYSSCGCTSLDKPEQPIPPYGTLQIPLKINVSGRIGEFFNSVSLSVDGFPAPVTLDICGEIIRDIWYNGQPVRCTLNTSAKQIETTFEVYTLDYPDISFDELESNDLFTVKEVLRTTNENKTTICFSVAINSLKESFSTSITLTPKNKQIKSLTVPLVCYFPKSEYANQEKSIATKLLCIGQVAHNESLELTVQGDSSILSHIDQVSLYEISDDFSVTQVRFEFPDSLILNFSIGSDVPRGLFEGKIRLTSSVGKDYAIPIIGSVR